MGKPTGCATKMNHQIADAEDLPNRHAPRQTKQWHSYSEPERISRHTTNVCVLSSTACDVALLKGENIEKFTHRNMDTLCKNMNGI